MQGVTFGEEGVEPWLEGITGTPEGTCKNALVIITHPHSKLGGDLHNNVVNALQMHLIESGFHTLSFNFRGVGGSGGHSTWGGKAEIEDVQLAFNFATKSFPQCQQVFLVGYSFGSAVGLASKAGFDGYVAVSYPYGYAASCALGSLFKDADSTKPKLFLSGEKDQFASTTRLKSFCDNLQTEQSLMVFENIDHFWHGKESLLFQPIVSFLVMHIAAMKTI